MTDYAALASQLGGQSDTGSTDLSALAAKYGGVPETPAANSDEVAKSQMVRKMLSVVPGGQFVPDIAMGMKQTLDAAAQLAARGAEKLGSGLPIPIANWLTEQRQKTEQANQATLDTYNEWAHPEAQSGAGLARGIGQALATGPITPALKAGGVIKGILSGGGIGAGAGALTPVYGAGEDNYWQQKWDQAKHGAMLGGPLGAAGTVIGKVLAPETSAAQKVLGESGVSMTPGQALGGWAKSIEDKLTSFPVIGDLIQARRFSGITDFNRAIYSKAVEPFGVEGAAIAKTADVGNAGIKKVGDFLSSKYEEALAKSVPNKIDEPFMQGLTQVAGMVPTNMRQQFVDIIKRNVASKVTEGTLTPSVAKAAESELGRLASSYRGSPIASERELGTAIAQAQAELRDLVARNNPEVAPLIQAANQGWRTLVQMENAGSMLGAKDGIFSPAQFLNAVKKSDKSLRDRQFARGDAYNQDFAQAAERVLPSKIPDSGTVGRGTIAAGLGAIGGVGSLEPLSGAAMAATALPYLPGISPLLGKLIAGQRPQSVATLGDLLKQLAPYGGFAAASQP